MKISKLIFTVSLAYPIFLVLVPPIFSADWYDSNWQHRKEITIDHAQVVADLTNFPLLVAITDSDLSSKAQSDGDDILFTSDDGVTKFNHEIESYDDSTGHLVAWVKIPSLSSLTDTVIYMYYGNPGASSQENPTGVWDSNYVMVQHLEETSGTHEDSTATNNDGTAYGALDQDEDGKIDGSDHFDGTNDYISCGSSNMPTTAGTVEAWVKPDGGFTSGGAYSESIMEIGSTGSNRIIFYFKNTNGKMRLLVYRVAPGALAESNATSWSEQWYHMVGTWDSTATRLFIDGSENSTPASGHSISTPTSASIGAEIIGGAKNYFDGIIDEVRVSNIVRAPEWIETEYNNQSYPGSFYNVGTEESPGIPQILNPVPADSATNIPTSLSQLQFDLDDPDDDPMDYIVTTSPYIGSTSGTGVYDGTYTINVSNPDPYKMYSWTVQVTDGIYPASKTYTFTTAPGTSSWWDSAWTHREKITIDNTKVSAELSNFILLVDITGADLASNAQEDGDDIVFTDYYGTKLDHEIELYDESTGHLVAWVEVPTLYSNMDTILYIYFGNSGATNQENPSGVWDADYNSVYHLHDDLLDSTSNANDGTNHDSTDTTGKIADGQSFDGNDYITAPNHYLGANASWTTSYWFNSDSSIVSPPSTHLYFYMISTGAPPTTDPGAVNIYQSTETASRGEMRAINLDTDSSQAGIYEYSGTNYQDDTWHLAYVTWDASSHQLSIYVDGSEEASTTNASVDNGAGTANSLHIGIRADLNTDRSHIGDLDEVRIAGVVRSPEWIATEYNNQNNPGSFYTMGTPETGYPLVSDPAPADDATDVAISLTQLCFDLEDQQADPMDYTVATNPNIGSGSGNDVADGRYCISVSNLDYDNSYEWTVTVDDGNGHVTGQTYSFTTEIITTFDPFELGWGYRKQITIDHTKVNANLTDFPVLIDIIDDDLAAHAQADGDDILFMDGDGVANKLDHEIELYQASSPAHLVAWVRIPLLSSSTDTTIYLYYGKPGTSSKENPEGVWDTSFDGVWHLDEISGTVYDSTSHNYDGTPLNGAIQDATGKVDGTDEFDGVNDSIATTYYPNDGAHTLEFLMNVDSLEGNPDSISGQYYQSVGCHDSQNHRFYGGIFYDTVESESEVVFGMGNGYKGGTVESAATGMSAGTWYYIVVTADGSIARYYLDTIEKDSFTYTQTGSSVDGFHLGSKTLNKSGGGLNPLDSFLDGKVDEVRISNVVRSAEWLAATFENITDPAGFSILGEEEMGNQPPTQDDPLLASELGNNTTDEDLICNAQNVSDPNGDDVYLTYNWFKNGTSLANLLMPFNTESSSTAKDYSGYDNDGTVNGATWSSGGIVGGAYSFDGTDDYLSIPDDATLDGDGTWSEMTMELWVKSDKDNQAATIMLEKRGASSAARSYQIGFDANGNSQLFCGYYLSGGYKETLYSDAGSLSTGQWYHVACSYKNGEGIKLYVDGVLDASEATASGTINASSNVAVILGKRGADNTRYFKGEIDEVKIYPFALTAEQINQNYLQSKDGLSNEVKVGDEETEVGDEWRCEATPSDLMEDGITKQSNTLTIVEEAPNQPPTHDNPQLASELGNNTTDEDLICTAQNVSDPNGDDVYLTYNWHKDGVSLVNLLMPFNTESSSTAQDYSGYDNDGTVNGAIWTSSGIVGGAYSFDGTDDYLSIPDAATLDGNGTWSEMTMEAWVKADVSQTGRIILAKWGPSTSRSYEVGINSTGNTQLFAAVDNGAYLETLYTDVNPLVPGTWYHVAATYKAGVVDLYINGVLDATRSNAGGTIKASADSLKIGARNPTPERFFDGDIDEVRIYPFALTAEQINQNYLQSKDGLSGEARVVSEETALGDEWQCEATPSDLMEDGITKQSNTLTIVEAECTTHDDCGFCEKCEGGSCVLQAGEDVKGECPDEACATGLCNGAGACGLQPPSYECRTSVGVCDLPEHCTGISAECPPDLKSTAECRASAGLCDLAESCDGISNNCPSDGYLSGTECRAAAGVCDLPETCTGSSPDCPADAKSSAECRASAGICDLAEFCNGISDECPSDAKSTDVCRPSQGVCDIAESCDGSNNDCPANVFEPPTSLCRASAGVCDISEYCTGDSAGCPADVFESPTTLCRASAEVCDAAEYCTGDSAPCPDDGYQPDGTPCEDGLYCTQIDECIRGECIGKNDPCTDNGDYCDGVEYCEEDIGSYICSSTGDACGERSCNELDDSCDDSDVTLIIADAYGYSGDIDIKLKNCCNLIQAVHVDICDVDHRIWLHISAESCSTTSRTYGFSCTLSDLGNNCVRIDLTSSGSAAITPGTGAIAQIEYTLDTNAPIGEYADLEPKNINVVEKDTLESLLVTPIPGKIQVVYTDSDSDGFPDLLDNCPDIPNGPLLGTCLKIYGGGYFKSTGIICNDEEACGENEICDTYQLDCNENGIGDACEIDSDGDAVPDGDDNCPGLPNGPTLGTCICGGNSCMSDGACEYGSCSMNQEDTNNDDVGDACDQSLCRAYLCRYENCIALQASGRSVDYSACKALTNQGEDVCEGEAAGCYWNPTGLPYPGACIVDLCLSNADFNSAIDGLDLAVYKKELFRVDCPYDTDGDLCKKYSYLYNYCVDLYSVGRNLDYNACKALTTQGESVCEAAGCYWNPTGLPYPGACIVDLCQSNSNFDSAVDGKDLAVYKKELFRVDCPK